MPKVTECVYSPQSPCAYHHGRGGYKEALEKKRELEIVKAQAAWREHSSDPKKITQRAFTAGWLAAKGYKA